MSEYSAGVENNEEAKISKTLWYSVINARKNTNENSLTSMSENEEKPSEAMIIKIKSPLILPTMPN